MCCQWIRMPDGTTAIVCSRPPRRRPCAGCGRPSTLQCDYPTGSRGKTCDAYLCRRCADPQGGDRDYCRTHAAPAQASLFG